MEAQAMKNDLTCGVVRDLLPSYVENLLGEESREAVDRHLENCPDCTARKDAMSAPSGEAEETAKEVDFLKRVKKRGFKRMVLAAAVTAILVLGGLGLKVFVIGTPLQPQSVAVVVSEVHPDNTLYLSLMSTGSGSAFHGWEMETEDGVTSIYARDVLVSPLYRSGQKELTVPLNFVREVWLGGTSGRLLWADGVVITQKTLDLLAAKTPYCGNASALGRITNILDIQRTLGTFTTSLHTSSQPYVWELEFQEGMQDSRLLRYYMYQMLALVENLDKMAYTYRIQDPYSRTASEVPNEGSVSAESASKFMAALTKKHNEEYRTDWPIHESIKEYAESPLEYERMVTLLRERFLENRNAWSYS